MDFESLKSSASNFDKSSRAIREIIGRTVYRAWK